MRNPLSRTTTRLAGGGLATGAVVAALIVAPSAAWAAAPTLSPSAGPAGTVVTATHADINSADAIGAIFTTNTTCPDKYTTTITGQTVVAATSPTKATSTTATFVVPSTLPLGANGAVKSYNVCVFNGTVANTSSKIGDAVAVFSFTPSVTLSPTSGASGGGNALTATLPATSALFTSAPGVRFAPGVCPAAYDTNVAGTVDAGLATRTSSTVATVTVPAGVLGTGLTTPYNVCFYTNATTGTLLASTATAYNVTLPAITLSSTVGPSTGGNGISAISTANFLLGVTTLGALFTNAATCPAKYAAGITYNASTEPRSVVQAAPGTVRKVANNRLAVTVPALPQANSAPTLYQACFYNGTTVNTSTLLASSGYTSTTVQTLTSITPGSGSAMGGNTITVIGTGFPTTPGSITATLGGLPLTDVNPISPTAFSATAPMHGVENDVTLVVTTPAGTRTLLAAYDFVNSISVTPNTSPNTVPSVDLLVRGVGFLSTNFGNGVSNAHLYLVDGVYNGDIVAGSRKVNGPVSECSDVLAISDAELICTLVLNRRLDVTGALVDPAVTAIRSDNALVTTNNSRVVTGTGFTVADIGQPIGQTAGTAAIPAGTTIVDVLSATTALISKAATSAGTVTVNIGTAAVRTNNTIDLTNSSTAVSADAGTFTAADIGRGVTGTGITTGSVITAVNAAGDGATLSLATASNAAGTNVSVTFYEATRVPDGAYNLIFVSTGTANSSSDPDYSQSVVSSGSTFTVASS
jgi:hypothetical protein